MQKLKLKNPFEEKQRTLKQKMQLEDEKRAKKKSSKGYIYYLLEEEENN